MIQGEVFNVTALGLAYDRHYKRMIKDGTMTNKLGQFEINEHLDKMRGILVIIRLFEQEKLQQY